MNQEDIIIDGYTIVSRLGGGGFGEVFLGRANNTGREVRGFRMTTLHESVIHLVAVLQC